MFSLIRYLSHITGVPTVYIGVFAVLPNGEMNANIYV